MTDTGTDTGADTGTDADAGARTDADTVAGAVIRAGADAGARAGADAVTPTEAGASAGTGVGASAGAGVGDVARTGGAVVVRGGAGAGVGRGRIPEVAGFARRGRAGGGKAYGKALRERVPRAAHADFVRDPERPDPVDAVEESNRGRLPALTPLRAERMAASPFAFLRGTAGLMAYDLARTPVTGVGAQLCGDAHAANFGLYGDARGELVIDLNDFDETVYGPWEWDVKRLATSLVLAGREAGASEEVCADAARDAAGAYRHTMRLLAKLPALDAWHAVADESLVSHADAKDLAGTLGRVAAKARRNTSARFAARSTEATPEGGRRFVDAPPVLRRVGDAEAAGVARALGDWLGTIAEDRLPLLARYAVHDVAFRVVGTGSVGTRSYVVLLLDHRGEALVLQVKEARPSALLPHLATAGFPAHEPVTHEGRRVVLGQRRMQVVSDHLLGWTTIDELPYQVRQFRNRKGSVDPVSLAPAELDDYARMTGALLARAHAHTADPRVIAGYCGKSGEFEAAVGEFARVYADVTEGDHARFVAGGGVRG
ncbi:DUF2252 domain-containing protein [Streptomyces sp. P6-2-1]|uniref:DUF2252 domain-containing protein n=1 Tax=Streptomyces sp. P6-2-1 TaxID=3422591 RepID=UPI003D36C056